MGKDIQKIFITDSDALHIMRHHGQNEEKRGQVDITPADFALISVVMNEFDTVEHTGEDKHGNKKLFLPKNDNIINLGSIERGNDQIGVITMWKKGGKSPVGCLMFGKDTCGIRYRKVSAP